jgi:hypothetical protein
MLAMGAVNVGLASAAGAAKYSAVCVPPARAASVGHSVT